MAKKGNHTDIVMKKGFKGTRNTQGRPKGTPNKATAEVREAFNTLITSNLPQLEKDIKSLRAVERAKLLIDMAKLILPKLQAIELTDLTEPSAEFKNPIIIQRNENSTDK